MKFERDKEVSTNFYSAVTIAGDKLKKLESRIEKVVKENTEQVKAVLSMQDRLSMTERHYPANTAISRIYAE